ncbi:MAG: hypothetical protein A3G34_00685 [Candidatus Lindowbacteria bacterium RIFCSPLOWO2_12_FULL_62_27]|nr:MAG: hypothetical protein A3G34_00685 [Candidatus Lindowbacteria bacterium RIFCSPLOWO2_12_FULL_62_27]OGH58173.1 MAG: hypothetical protein A3I06_00865 [Candidatus Lindowbacteria bacterium RIFCSPLOWO2_02_FULL_62_12]
MLDAAKEAREFVSGRSRPDLDSSRMLALSLVKCIEIVGEAATKVSDETRNRQPHVPWLDIVGMRNRLIHAYFDINLDILWSTITQDMPPLITALENLLSEPLPPASTPSDT